MDGEGAYVVKDTENMMRQAVAEIRDLRRRNEVLSAQAFVVEAFHAALLGHPRGMGASPDLCWEIERYLDRENRTGAAAGQETIGS